MNPETDTIPSILRRVEWHERGAARVIAMLKALTLAELGIQRNGHGIRFADVAAGSPAQPGRRAGR